MRTQILKAYALKDITTIEVPSNMIPIWRIAYSDIRHVIVLVCTEDEFSAENLKLNHRISDWLTTKAEEYSTKFQAMSTDPMAPVHINVKHAVSEMPVTASFSDVGGIDTDNTLTTVDQMETANEMETPVVRLAELAERYPNFFRQFVSEFCDTFAIYVYQGREL